MLRFRKATCDDLLLYFEWANDEMVRKQSFQDKAISLEIHRIWFLNKLEDSNCLMLLFENEDNYPVGQIRLQKENETSTIIGVSISKEFRGQGLASRLLKMASDYYLINNPIYAINAYIKINNESSIRAFKKANFIFHSNLIYQDVESALYKKSLQQL